MYDKELPLFALDSATLEAYDVGSLVSLNHHMLIHIQVKGIGFKYLSGISLCER